MSLLKKKNIFYLFVGFCFWLSLSPIIQFGNAIDGVIKTGPSRYSQEAWSLTMGGTKNDEGKVVITDNATGDVFWGITTITAEDQTFGIISRVNRTGSLLWQRDCLGYFNLSYSIPMDIIVSNDGLSLFALVIYNNDTFSTDKLALFELNATDGVILHAVSLVDSNIRHYAKMSWINSTHILIAYAKEHSPSGIDSFLIQYRISTHTPLNPVEIPMVAENCWPITLEVGGLDNKIILTMSSSNPVLDENTSLFVVNCASENILLSNEMKIGLNGNYNLTPIGSMSRGDHLYLVCYKETNLYLISLDRNFGVEFYTPLSPGVSKWTNMLVNKDSQLFLLGYGTLSFGTDSYSENQAYMLQFNLNAQANGFTSGAIFKYGELSTSDVFVDFTLSSKDEIFITGAGYSYGVSPNSDTDGYLVKWNTGLYPLPDLIPETPMDWQPYIMIIMIVAVSVALIALGYFSSKKSHLATKAN